MPRLRVLRQAADEAEAAAAWYEQERPGLGAEFFEAIEAGLDVIEDGFLPSPRCLDSPAIKEQNVSFSAAFHTISLSSIAAMNGSLWRLLIILEDLAIGEIVLAPNA